MRPVALLLCLVVPLLAQPGPTNLDFKEISIAGKPAHWSWTADPNFSVTMIEDCRRANSRCAMFHSPSDRVPRGHGTLMQTFDATAFRGKHVRYRAWLRVEAPTMSGAQLFMRVDRPSGTGFHNYTPGEKARSIDWTMSEIVGKIDPDALRITIGMRITGLGGAAIADPEFEALQP